MDVDLAEKKPTWWQLYTLGAALVGWVWLIDASVASPAARLSLEIGAVVTMSVLMLIWLRVNRGRIELAETRVARRDALEPIAQHGSPAPVRRARPLRGTPSGTLIEACRSDGPIPTSCSSASANRRRGERAAS